MPEGYYPFEWVIDIKKLDHKCFPPKDAFYSSLTQESTTENEYAHAQKVNKQLKCKTVKDYTMTYLKCNLLLLADVSNNCKKNCMTYHNLDPTTYLTSPSLGDAMLLRRKIELGLFQ